MHIHVSTHAGHTSSVSENKSHSFVILFYADHLYFSVNKKMKKSWNLKVYVADDGDKF